MFWQKGIGVCLAAILVFSLGCGRSGRPATVKVTGTVTYRGTPVEGATVGFIPEYGRPASGKTDSNGRFTLSTFAPGDGAVPGQHKVVISDMPPEQPMPGTPEAQAWKPPAPRFPAKYADAATSGFTATVQKGQTNDFTFDMKD
ncbi:MAG: carboxypeptidase-like regulatory domain-containing protein [Thermoguttaceae bacterium]